MKKSLLAIAAMTAFAGAAQAQSSVTVYGILDVGVRDLSQATTNTSSVKTNGTVFNTGNGSALSTSRLGFKGTEDLGGGLKAEFMLEYGINDPANGGTTTDAIYNNRESWVGLNDSKMGALRLGKQAQSVHAVITNGSAGAANNMPGAVYTSNTGNVAGIRPHAVYLNQAVTYISPTVSGFSVQAQTANYTDSASDAAAASQAIESGASITFSGVKNLKAAYGISQKGISVANTSNVKQTVQALSVNYDFKVAKVFALGTFNKVDNNSSGVNYSNTKAYEFGVAAPVTPKIGVWASMFTGDRSTGTASTTTTLTSSTTAALASADVSGYQLGTTYAFSKRTTAYAIYGTQSIKGKDAAANAKNESTGYAVGLRHSF